MIITHDHNHNRIRNDTHHPSLPFQLQFISSTGLDLNTRLHDISHTTLKIEHAEDKTEQKPKP